MGDENPRRTLGDYSRPSHEGYRNTIEVPNGNDLAPLRSDTIRQTIDQAAGGKLHDKNDEESWALLEDVALYDNETSSINDDEKTFPPPRRVRFVNTTTLVKKEKESRDTTPREHEGLTSEVDDEVGSNELEKEEEDDLEYFNMFPSMKELEYHEWRHYKQIMSQKLESRKKPSNLCKRSNFVGSVRGLKVFIENFTYECDFMILEDTTSIIDHDLGEISFGKPFIEETSLAYDKEEGTIVFRRNDENITFKMPRSMEMFRHIDLKDMNTDPIPPSVLGNKNEHGKVYYSNSLNIGPEYKQNESVIFDKEKPESS
ncbi:hypothetical protein Tco_0186381 [Tanacetum coccineum]